MSAPNHSIFLLIVPNESNPLYSVELLLDLVHIQERETISGVFPYEKTSQYKSGTQWNRFSNRKRAYKQTFDSSFMNRTRKVRNSKQESDLLKIFDCL